MIFEHVEVDLGYDDLEAQTSESGRIYFHPNGEKNYPSITTVLKILSEESIKKWRQRIGEEEADKISFRAANRGTAVHELIEKYLDNCPQFKDGYMPDIIDSFMNVKMILDQRIGKIFSQEVPLFSDHLKVAGRVDCVAEFDGKLSIIDFKTSRRFKSKSHIESYFMQEAFYAIAWEERTGMPITQLVTIISVDGGGSQVFIENRDDWVDGLKETISTYNSRHIL